ncbi:MAG: hypothetical protein AVDCRST_MAG24-1873, partial [uncultured Nocardioidaceae bacterium]
AAARPRPRAAGRAPEALDQSRPAADAAADPVGRGAVGPRARAAGEAAPRPAVGVGRRGRGRRCGADRRSPRPVGPGGAVAAGV